MFLCQGLYLSMILGVAQPLPVVPLSGSSPRPTDQSGTGSLPAGLGLPPTPTEPVGTVPVVPNKQILDPSLVHFDPLQLELRWQAGSWQLWAGEVLLKDFGPHLAEARQALYLARQLHWTEHGTLGTPRPILEYWLSNGQAPQGPGAGRLVPLDPTSLRVELLQGQWWVRDGRRLLFNFGMQQEEAQKALAVLRHYGFTHVGYLGWPQPLLIYFLRQPGLPSSTPSAPSTTQTTPIAPMSGAHPANHSSPAASNRWPLVSHQLAPPVLAAQTVVRFDPWHLRLQVNDGRWQLISGNHVLARFTNLQEAQSALAAVQYYRFTEQVYLGTPGQSFSFFLVHGQPPRGLRPGLFGVAFAPETVTVQQVGDHWLVLAGPQPLENFGSRRAEAEQLVQVIQRYRFDHFYRIGPVGPDSLTFLIQSR